MLECQDESFMPPTAFPMGYDSQKKISQSFQQFKDLHCKGQQIHHLQGLIERIDAGGDYQCTIVIFFAIIWFVNGFLMSGNAFLFLSDYDCHGIELSTSTCAEYVCSLDESQRTLYQRRFSLGDCASPLMISFATSCLFLGSFLGGIFISPWSTFYGRRPSLLQSLLLSIVGLFSLFWLPGWVALMLSGFGINAAAMVCVYVVFQIMKKDSWQKTLILLNFFYSAGAIAVTFLYYYFTSWTTIVGVVLLPSLCLATLCLYIFMEETPFHLLTRELPPQEVYPQDAVIAATMNRMRRMNEGKQISTEDVERVREDRGLVGAKLSQMDLLTYYRKNTIACSIIGISISALYTAPTLFVAQLGPDIYISNLVMNVAELLSYLPAYWIVDKHDRKELTMWLFGAIITVGVVLSVNKHLVFALCLVFAFRFFVCIQFALFNVLQSEVFPVAVRAIATTFVNSIGAASAVAIPSVVGLWQGKQLNPMTLMIGVALLGSFFVKRIETQ